MTQSGHHAEGAGGPNGPTAAETLAFSMSADPSGRGMGRPPL